MRASGSAVVDFAITYHEEPEEEEIPEGETAEVVEAAETEEKAEGLEASGEENNEA